MYCHYTDAFLLARVKMKHHPDISSTKSAATTTAKMAVIFYWLHQQTMSVTTVPSYTRQWMGDYCVIWLASNLLTSANDMCLFYATLSVKLKQHFQ